MGTASFKDGRSLFKILKTFIDAVVNAVIQERHVNCRKRETVFILALHFRERFSIVGGGR